MNVEFCIFNTKTNMYFFNTSEEMVGDYLSVHYSDCRDDK